MSASSRFSYVSTSFMHVSQGMLGHLSSAKTVSCVNVVGFLALIFKFLHKIPLLPVVAKLEILHGFLHIFVEDPDVIFFSHDALGLDKVPCATGREASPLYYIFSTMHYGRNSVLYLLQTYSASIWPSNSNFVPSNHGKVQQMRESCFRWLLR